MQKRTENKILFAVNVRKIKSTFFFNCDLKVKFQILTEFE